MLYITSPGLIYLITGSLYLLTLFSHFAYQLACHAFNCHFQINKTSKGKMMPYTRFTSLGFPSLQDLGPSGLLCLVALG